jgi:hypothetical protein
MKITRKQLRRLIEQVAVITISPDDEKALEKEKGDVDAEKERIAAKYAAEQPEDGPSASIEDIKKAITEVLEKKWFYKK